MCLTRQVSIHYVLYISAFLLKLNWINLNHQSINIVAHSKKYSSTFLLKREKKIKKQMMSLTSNLLSIFTYKTKTTEHQTWQSDNKFQVCLLI